MAIFWYLMALLCSTAITFTSISQGHFCYYKGGPWVGGLVGLVGALLLLSRRGASRCAPTRCAPTGVYPLAGLALGRLISAVWHGSGWQYVLVAVAAVAAYPAMAEHKDRIQADLQNFGIGLVGLEILQLGTGYFINLNLMAHLLLISLAAWLPEIRRGGRWIPAASVAAALVATTSKGASIAMVIMLAVYWRHAWVALPVAPAAGALVWLARPWKSVQWRLKCWAAAWAKICEDPVFGKGPGAFAWDNVMATHAHNGLLNILLWDGTVGMVLTGIGAAVVWMARSRYPRWALAGLLGVSVHYLVDDFTGCALCLVMVGALLAVDR